MVTPLPLPVQTALEAICDGLRRMVDGYDPRAEPA